jgi:hypothetical protein
MQTCNRVKIHRFAQVAGQNVPWSTYYVGRSKDGQMQTSAKPHNAALMTEALVGLLVTKLNDTGHPYRGMRTPLR